jgi:hypothetical protein
MDTGAPTSYGHSADVRIRLHVNGHILSISHLAPDYVIVRDPAEHPPTEAEIALSIDGRERRWRVRLVEGISPGRRETRIGPAA